MLIAGKYTEETLLIDLGIRKTEALELLVNAYFPILSSFADKIVNDAELAKDVAQEVFLRFWSGSESFATLAALKAWLYQSVRNRSLNALRSRQRQDARYAAAARQPEPDNDTILTEIVRAETLAAIHLVAQRLPQQLRTVFELHFRDGLPVKEIALKLGLSPKTVSNHRSKALTILRDQFVDRPDALLVILALLSRN